jgi:methyl-accepting chemotaxis protein
MVALRQVRGSGVRFTLPYVLRISGLWLAVSVLIFLLFSVTCYLLLLDRPAPADKGYLILVLGLQTLGVLAALLALAVFTTHRIAGPLVAFRRAMEEVRAGKLDTQLRLRGGDIHLRDLEESFNGMLESIRQRTAERGRSAVG